MEHTSSLSAPARAESPEEQTSHSLQTATQQPLTRIAVIMMRHRAGRGDVVAFGAISCEHRHTLERSEQTLFMVDAWICTPSFVTRDVLVDVGNDAPLQRGISGRTGRRFPLLALGTPSSRELSLVETGRPIRPFLRPD